VLDIDGRGDRRSEAGCRRPYIAVHAADAPARRTADPIGTYCLGVASIVPGIEHHAFDATLRTIERVAQETAGR